MIWVSSNLKELCKLLEVKSKVYIVGGYVRNALLNLKNTDCDIASAITIEDLFSLLDGTRFLVKIKSAKMGTVEICVDNEVYEHTTFRKEIYDEGGFHSPKLVMQTLSAKEDAKRRDFTINALYYDVLSGEILDFYTGKEDIKNKIIKTVETPDRVFANDGLRILRMIRFASELNFSIDEETLNQAKIYMGNLRGISGERKYNELMLLLNADKKHQKIRNDGHLKGVQKIIELNLFKFIFNFKKVKYEFLLDDFKLLKRANDKDERFLAFILDFYFKFTSNNEMSLNEFIDGISNKLALNLSNKLKRQIYEIIKAYNTFYKLKNIRQFIAINYNHIKFLIFLFGVLDVENGNKIQREYQIMLHEKVPFTLKELKINGKDILKNVTNIEPTKVGKILDNLHKRCIQKPNLNNRKYLLDLAKNLAESL